MEKYEHGKMDISEQERTFHGFLRVCVLTALASILVLIFLAATQT